MCSIKRLTKNLTAIEEEPSTGITTATTTVTTPEKDQRSPSALNASNNVIKHLIEPPVLPGSKIYGKICCKIYFTIPR